MLDEQQLTSILFGWTLIAAVGAVVWFVRWSERRHIERERASKQD